MAILVNALLASIIADLKILRFLHITITISFIQLNPQDHKNRFLKNEKIINLRCEQKTH